MLSNVEKPIIKYPITMSLVEYVEFQFRLIFGNSIKSFSKGEIQVLVYFYLYPNLSDNINKLLENNIRSSKKSITNDLSKFKKEQILEIIDNRVVFNSDIVIDLQPSTFQIFVNLAQ